MQESEIYARLQEIFRETFDQEVELTPSTSADNVDGWDSFTHINLTLAIESEFGIRFKSSDLDQIKNVGDMVSFIQHHTAK